MLVLALILSAVALLLSACALVVAVGDAIVRDRQRKQAQAAWQRAMARSRGGAILPDDADRPWYWEHLPANDSEAEARAAQRQGK